MKTITALLMATLIMCPCSSIMAKNPAASVTDKAQKASISTIKDLDNGRLYVMDYTALTPAAVPSPDARKKASLSTDATLTIK